MSHKKINLKPTTWPIPSKGRTFIVTHSSKGIPILVLMRDILKLVRTRKELKKIIHERNILICGKEVHDEKKNIELMDTITLKPLKKNYRLHFDEKGKFVLKEINEKESFEKISKIVDKKILKGKKIQLNLSDGRNYLTNSKFAVNDSVIIDLKGNKIEKSIPFKSGSKALVIGGKHTGKTGNIVKIENKLKMAEIKTQQGEFNVLIKQLMAIQ